MYYNEEEERKHTNSLTFLRVEILMSVSTSFSLVTLAVFGLFAITMLDEHGLVESLNCVNGGQPTHTSTEVKYMLYTTKYEKG